MKPAVCPHCGKPLPKPPRGNPDIASAREIAIATSLAKAAAFRTTVLPKIEAIRASGITSLSGIARELARRGVKTAAGGAWTAQSVKNLLQQREG
jgi:hypothetical protein